MGKMRPLEWNTHPFQSFCGLPKVLWKARIYNIAHFATKLHVFSMVVHALIVLLSRASPKHSPHPASCFPAQLLVCYLQLCNQALTWGKYGLSSEMRPKCGPFYHFGLHADQVCNCGPLRKHCTLNKKKYGSYTGDFPQMPYVFIRSTWQELPLGFLFSGKTE